MSKIFHEIHRAPIDRFPVPAAAAEISLDVIPIDAQMSPQPPPIDILADSQDNPANSVPKSFASLADEHKLRHFFLPFFLSLLFSDRLSFAPGPKGLFVCFPGRLRGKGAWSKPSAARPGMRGR
ncbi:MAG: hypothetical protein IKT12_05295 [Thermoguttaceae bacterium]|nr:hypothetical protein [Thermoguttaceae bacterium]